MNKKFLCVPYRILQSVSDSLCSNLSDTQIEAEYNGTNKNRANSATFNENKRQFLTTDYMWALCIDLPDEIIFLAIADLGIQMQACHNQFGNDFQL